MIGSVIQSIVKHDGGNVGWFNVILANRVACKS